MAEGETKSKRGGKREGAGRPKSALTRCQELAICEGLIWYRSPEITAALIYFALNGDAGLLKNLSDRIFGRVEDRPPLIDRQAALDATLPDGFDPEAILAALHDRLMGSAAGEWTNAEANRVGRLGVRTLEKLAERGDKQAAAILARIHLPDPALTLGERLPAMDADEVRALLLERYRRRLRAAGYDERIAEVLVAADEGGEETDGAE